MDDDEYQIRRKYVNRNLMQELQWVSYYPPSGMSNQDKDFIRWLAMTAYDRINELEHQWIPVAERLPGPGEVVLVYGKRGGIYTAEHNRNGCWPRSFWKLNSKSHHCEPTHWMPLPEPPKDGV